MRFAVPHLRLSASARARSAAFALLAALASAAAPCALAQGGPYPAKPIRFMVPFIAGGPADMIARSISQRMNEAFGQPVVVENRGSAGGMIGVEAVARSPADGYTILIGNFGTHAINVSLYPKVPYDPVGDFAPIALVAGTPLLIVSHPSLTARTLKEFIALAKARPGQINYASAGTGGTSHLAAELFRMLAGINIVHVPYKGNSPAITALVSGESQLMFTSPLNPAPFIKAGRLRALAVSYSRRIQSFPDVPTAAEAGLPGLDVSGWYGLFAPAGTPREIVQRLHAEAARITALPQVRDYFLVQGIEPLQSTPEALGAHVKTEIVKWAKVVKASAISVE